MGYFFPDLQNSSSTLHLFSNGSRTAGIQEIIRAVSLKTAVTVTWVTFSAGTVLWRKQTRVFLH